MAKKKVTGRSAETDERLRVHGRVRKARERNLGKEVAKKNPARVGKGFRTK